MRTISLPSKLGLLPKAIDEVAASAPDNDKRTQNLSEAIADQPVDDCCSDEFYKVLWIKLNKIKK